MKLREILEGVKVQGCTADLDTEITDVVNDSRQVTVGALFAAVPGMKEDGAKYIPSALEKGAAAVLSEKMIEGAPCVVVENVRRAMSRAAANLCGRPTEKMTVIGITGTNGKTTSSYLVRHIIETVRGVSVGLIGTNEIIAGGEHVEATRTTPESVEIQKIFAKMAAAGEKYAVMEVSSHALALNRVADVKYRVGAFTNLTQDHLDFHDGMEDYFAAKAKLFKMCGLATINLDDEYGRRLSDMVGCPTVTTTARSESGAAISAERVTYNPGGVEFVARRGSEKAHVSLAIPGEFSVHNALTALGCVTALGISLEEAARALSEFGGVKGRAELVPTPTDYSVVIDYAHTPDGIENILRALKATTKGRVIIVFGCGGDRDRTKRPIMGASAEKLADFCVVTSDNPRSEEPESIIADILEGMTLPEKRVVIPDRREAIAWALGNAKTGDVVLLAGKGQETYQEIKGVKHHLDEREVVAQYFAK